MRILLIVALCLFASASGADQKADEAIQQERAKEERERYRAAVNGLAKLYRKEGMAAVEERIEDQPARMRLTLLNGMIGRLYWSSRDVQAVVASAERTLTLGAAAVAADPSLRDRVGPVHYNLASYTWPGWGGDDTKVVLTAAQIERGRRAAHANVALHDGLGSAPGKRSNSRWMAAAHEIAAGNDSAARRPLEWAVAAEVLASAVVFDAASTSSGPARGCTNHLSGP